MRVVDVFVCYNSVSYCLACKLASKKFSVIIFDQNRIKPKSKLFTIQVGLNNASLLLKWMRSLKVIDRFFLPHHSHAEIIWEAAASAKHVDYIDDGLDTLRSCPRNFKLDLLSKKSVYYTFSEYAVVGHWLEGQRIERVASLRDYPNYDFHRQRIIDLKGANVIVESLGLNTLPLNINDSVIVFPHPNPAKNHPSRIDVEGVPKCNIELSLLHSRATSIHVGESIIAVFLLLFCRSPDVRIYVYLENPNNFPIVKGLIDAHPNAELIDCEKYIAAPRSGDGLRDRAVLSKEEAKSGKNASYPPVLSAD